MKKILLSTISLISLTASGLAADFVVDSNNSPAGTQILNGDDSLIVTKAGVINEAGWVGVAIQNSNKYVVNNGSILTNSNWAIWFDNNATLSGNLENNGTIGLSNQLGIVLYDGAKINGKFINTDTINTQRETVSIGWTSNPGTTYIGAVINTGLIRSRDTRAFQVVGATISGGIDNKGTILALSDTAIHIRNSSTINSGLTNSGEITSSNSNALIIDNGSVINGGIINTGLISAGAGFNGIKNNGNLDALSNYQGVSGSGGYALKYEGNLPTLYNIIIKSNNYGQLSVSGAAGQTTFGVSTLSTNIQPKTYSSVLTGVAAANITNPNSQVYTFGKHASLWLKQQAGSATTWDLVFQSDGRISTQFLGYDDPNVVNTYTAMNSNRQATEGIIHQRYALLNALMQYDCNRFDKYGVCIQFQTRATGYGTQATGSGILNASYRIANKFRVGAYLDYQAFQGNPFGMYLGSGGVQQNNNNPSFGGYVGYSQNPDETGVQARASGGYNPGQVSVLRAVLTGTEPGYGNAGLNAYYAYGVAGYGVKIADGLVVTPYGGIQYTDVTRNGYTEQANLLMTIYPLAYNSYYERLVTGLFGAKAKGMLTDKLGYQLSLGAQVDFTRSANSYSGHSYVPGMEIYGIAHGGGWNGVRPAGMAGVFYDPLPNHRVSLNAYTSQQAWTTRTYTTGLLGYQIAF